MNTNWPHLKTYDEDHLARIALPLGGIGTGTVSLGGRGDLRDWELCNRPAKGFAPGNAFFALWAKAENQESVARVLEGPLDAAAYEGATGSPARHHGLPRFRHASFQAAYPLGEVLLSDESVPVDVRLQAFNPLVPGDAETSGLPVAILRFVLTNKTDATVEAGVCGVLQNFIGEDGTNKYDNAGNANEFRQTEKISGLFLTSPDEHKLATQWGTVALATTATGGVSHRTRWPKLSWGDSLLDFWDDWSADGKLEECAVENSEPIASLAASIQLAPGQARAVTFVLAWHFPNRLNWNPAQATPGCCDGAGCEGNPDWIGNYYTTRFADAWDAAKHAMENLEELEKSTSQWTRAFYESDLPEVVKEAAGFNLSTLRSQTCFRTPDGHFFGWEGCNDKGGSCHGSCTHVWNYEQATPYLFGDLARSMREVEFAHATDERGLMSFRVGLPLATRAQEFKLAAADGQMGCLMKLLREWKLSGDDEWLRVLWPHAKRALEFCWIPGGWDADRDGVMEGCQHNTMDVEYYGPNPQMQVWYLGALRACEEMAAHLGDDQFAATCRTLFERGRDWTDAHLWNGEYYEHEIRPQKKSEIAPGLVVGMGGEDGAEPILQLGAGCLVDQLVGQYMAHVCDLGYLLDETNVRSTLRSLMRFNFKENLWNHFNHLRTFALQEESAMLMATYPRGRRPNRPFPYYNEVMTGFEYTAAVGMLQEEKIEDGLKLIAAIRARYDGKKRSPFDEAECGHHYARAMASWAAVLALTGFDYSGITQTMRFAAAGKPAKWFWSSGAAWGTIEQAPRDGKIEVRLSVGAGVLALKTLQLRGWGKARCDKSPLRAGDEWRVTLTNNS